MYNQVKMGLLFFLIIEAENVATLKPWLVNLDV